MSRLKHFLRYIFKPWVVIFSSLIFILGVYDLFLSQFLSEKARDSWPKAVDLILRFGWQWWIWVILFLVVLLGSIAGRAFTLFMQLEKKFETKKLGYLREEGVKIRNEGTILLSKNSVDKWRQVQLEWEGRVEAILLEFPTFDYESFHRLNTYTPRRKFPSAFDNNHAKYLEVFDEKLSRLEEIIKHHSV